MKRLLFSVLSLALVGIATPEAQAQNGSDPGIPKVDYRVGQLRVSDNRLSVIGLSPRARHVAALFRLGWSALPLARSRERRQ